MKSLFSGALLGLLTGGIAIGAASVFLPQPAGNTPPAPLQLDAPLAATQTPPPAQTLPTVAEITQDTTQPAAPAGLDVQAPGALPQADTSPADPPVATDVAASLAVPAQTTLPDIVATDVTPVLPNPQSIAPQVPRSENNLVVSTEPAIAPEIPVIVVDDDPQTPVVVQEDPAPDVVAVLPAPETPEIVAPPADIAPDVATLAPAEVQAPDALQNDIAAPLAEAAAPALVDTPQLDAPARSDTGPVIVAQADIPPTTPRADRSPPAVLSLTNDATGSRLPQGVSDIPVNRATGVEEAPADDPEREAVPLDPDAPAIDQFAAAFDNPEDKPTMAVILLDDGTLADSAAALAQVPFAVTVVLDPTVANAAEAMAAYRAAGIEVAVLAALPQGAQPSDVEVTLAAAFGALPETVALVDPGQGNLRDDRDVMAQAMAALAENGRGLITVPRGLNSGIQDAEDAGVPTGLIFRDLDSEGQDARVIRRFMDQAAFRARQEPGVILLGRMRPETLDALIEWGDANRAGQVAMAPVSAILTIN